jgi:hypothetical protein
VIHVCLERVVVNRAVDRKIKTREPEKNEQEKARTGELSSWFSSQREQRQACCARSGEYLRLAALGTTSMPFKHELRRLRDQENQQEF